MTSSTIGHGFEYRLDASLAPPTARVAQASAHISLSKLINLEKRVGQSVLRDSNRGGESHQGRAEENEDGSFKLHGGDRILETVNKELR